MVMTGRPRVQLRLGSRVLKRAGAAWFVENRADAQPNVVPIPELERIIGIDLLPALSAADKERVLKLPTIRTDQGRGKSGRGGGRLVFR